MRTRHLLQIDTETHIYVMVKIYINKPLTVKFLMREQSLSRRKRLCVSELVKIGRSY